MGDHWDFSGRLAGLAANHRLRIRRTLESAQGREIVVGGRKLLNFAGNDYLGLAGHPALAAAAAEAAQACGVGAGAAHFLSGHHASHAELESRLAAHVRCEAALLLSTGYLANQALLTALADRGSVIVADRLNHACLNEGARLSRATFRRYAHADLEQADRLLGQAGGVPKLLVTDAVFSMDGDLAPLPGLLALAERHDALLVVDDAHGFGVLGPQGRGSLAAFGLQSPRIVLMATLGKAAGTAGAFIAGNRDVVDWIMQTGPAYLFSTAAPPMIAAASLSALGLVAQGDDLRARLTARIRELHDQLAPLADRRGWRRPDSSTAIQPLIIGDNARALALSDQLLSQGVWAPVIRPPTVPEGTARLRISLSASHEAEDIHRLVSALQEAHT